MGYNKITNLFGKLDKDEIPKFINLMELTLKIKTNQLRNDLCDFNDAYIVVTGKITVRNPGMMMCIIERFLLKFLLAFSTAP